MRTVVKVLGPLEGCLSVDSFDWSPGLDVSAPGPFLASLLLLSLVFKEGYGT